MMGKILLQRVLLIIKMCILKSGTAVENSFFKLKEKLYNSL